MKTETFRIVNTPAFTTATAWRRAETGVGATMAAGKPPMEGHDGCLPHPKNEEGQEDGDGSGPDVPVQDSARPGSPRVPARK
jgi:hypothetical protein